MATADNHRPIVAFGPEMPGWGSWEWLGADLHRELSSYYQTLTFPWPTIPDCDVVVVIKHAGILEAASPISKRAGIIFCPVDAYGSVQEIEADRDLLRLSSRIVVHCQKLARYFTAYAPVEYMDHHVKFVTAPRQRFKAKGYFLWVGVRSNLPSLIAWLNDHPLPGEPRILTNPEIPGQLPALEEFGYRGKGKIRMEPWSEELHLAWAKGARAVLDIKGHDFRSWHKPAAKAIDWISSGIPLAMNGDSSPVEHLASMGFDIPSPLDQKRWLSRDYWQETQEFGAALRVLLSLSRVGRRWKRLIDQVLIETGHRRPPGAV